MYITTLPSPVGQLTLASDGEGLTGLWLENQKYFAAGLAPHPEEASNLPLFQQAAAWLDHYFAGQIPVNHLPIIPKGTAFQQAVWNRLLEIPYGQTITYGELAASLGTSPRAAGNAVGRNPISILIPCHRVMGADGSLTGYAGGVEKKRFLLELEQRSVSLRKKALFLPTAVQRGKTGDPPGERQPEPGKFPCPCCGYLTFPVPKEDAIAYICPVCFWENDVFTVSDDEPSDENRGMTLNQAREAFRTIGAVRQEFLQYTRKPLPEERNG